MGKQLNEGYTSFGSGHQGGLGGVFGLGGHLSRFYSLFFGTKVKDKLDDNEQEPYLAGDTIVDDDLNLPMASNSHSGNSSPSIGRKELTRRECYQDYERMDVYPEIGAAFDIYADDITQDDIEGRSWNIETEDKLAKAEIEEFFETIRLDRFLWDIARNTVKYGECFTEAVIDLNSPKEGIKRLKILDPNFIYRAENKFGQLENFLQEIPKSNSIGNFSAQHHKRDFLPLDRNQVTHFRLFTSDRTHYPYGKSIAFSAREIYRSLRYMEDAMLIYRLSRAPERRVFYIDTGNLPTAKAQEYINKLKNKFKKTNTYDPNNNQVGQRYNPASPDEDFFFPTKAGSNTKIDVLPGAQNLGDVDDVKYFRDKLLATLKIPKDYIVEKDKSPERKANLSQLDVRFAKVIARIQGDIALGLESLAKRHLQLKGYPALTIQKLRVKLPSPSDMFEKRKLDVEEQRLRVIQGYLGMERPLFSREHIYKEVYNYDEDEIKALEDAIEKDVEKSLETQQAMGMGMDPMMGGAPMDGSIEGSDMALDPQAGGGQEPDENQPPTQQESTYELLRQRLLNEGSLDAEKQIMLAKCFNKTKNS